MRRNGNLSIPEDARRFLNDRTSIAVFVTNRAPLAVGSLSRELPATTMMREAMFDYWFTFVSPNVAMIDANAGDAVIESISEEVFATYLGHWFERACSR